MMNEERIFPSQRGLKKIPFPESKSNKVSSSPARSSRSSVNRYFPKVKYFGNHLAISKLKSIHPGCSDRFGSLHKSAQDVKPNEEPDPFIEIGNTKPDRKIAEVSH